ERDFGKLGSSLGGQARSRFPGDQEAPQDRILRLAVLQKLLARLPGDVAPNDLDRTKDIEQIGGLLRRYRFHGWIEGSTGGGSRSHPAQQTGASADQPRIRGCLRSPCEAQRNPTQGVRRVET